MKPPTYHEDFTVGVDGEKMSPDRVGYIYEVMDRAKEEIVATFGNNGTYIEIFNIIDNKWNYQLHRPLHAADA
ncbi:hypothetical protein OROMI_001170 [Orobanche minor]